MRAPADPTALSQPKWIGKPSPREQRRGLVQRQADDIGVGADDLDDEGAGEPLRGIAAGLAAPFAGGEIGLDVLLRQPLEAHAGLDQPLAERLLRRHQADRRCGRGDCGRTAAAGIAPPRRAVRPWAGCGGRPPPRCRRRGCRSRRSSSSSFTAASAASALPRASRLAQARGNSPRLRHLVDVGGPQRVRLDADLIDQGQPARRTGCENEFGTADHRSLRNCLCGRIC